MADSSVTEHALDSEAPMGWDQIVRTGPETLAGRYLRRIWQPVYHSADIAAGKAKPVRIMGETFTLYRGASGELHMVDGFCPHRGMQLSAGTVEGEAIRCFYHGWKFDGAGKCIEQPAEESRFCAKIRIRSYPVREYVGLVFAFLGEGAPPEFPLYPEFEYFDGLLEIDSYQRDCNYYQNLENALDMSHVGYVHSDNVASFSGIGLGRSLSAEETDWGVEYTFPSPGRAGADQPLRDAEHLQHVCAAHRPGDSLAGVALLVGADRRRLARAVQPAPRPGSR